MKFTLLSRTSFVLFALVLAACSAPAEVAPPVEEVAPTQVPATAVPVEPEPTQVPPTQQVDEATTEIDLEDNTTEDIVADAVEAPTAEAAPATVITPIDVTYFTPTQTEGPYYTVEKPTDRDNDLLDYADASALAAGEELLLSGTIYDATGMPLTGIVIEIWQTDANGVYLHPQDPTTDQRDLNFQFYGETTTSSTGAYNFRTIRPGEYEPRPVHIHVKVKGADQTLLTTQFYFSDDPQLAGENIFAEAGDDGQHLLIQVDPAAETLTGVRDIVLATAYPEFHAQAAAQSGAAVEDAVAAAPVAAASRINLNAMTREELTDTIPDFSNRMVREFFEYQPYTSIEQFRAEIGKYVDAEEVAFYEQYIFVPVDINEADEATMLQIPGIDADSVGSIMFARPYNSNDEFMMVLSEFLTDEELAQAPAYLAP